MNDSYTTLFAGTSTNANAFVPVSRLGGVGPITWPLLTITLAG